jgi:hypothetical protein
MKAGVRDFLRVCEDWFFPGGGLGYFEKRRGWSHVGEVR